MVWTRLGAHARWVVWSCFGAALVVAVGLPLFAQAQFYLASAWDELAWATYLLVPVPMCAALVAVVLTRVPWVGFTIGGVTALVGSVAGLVGFLGVARSNGGAVSIGALGLIAFLLLEVVAALPLLAADLQARRSTGFTPATGAVAGATVGVFRAVLRGGSVVAGVGVAGLGRLPAAYLLVDLLLPLVLLALTGAVAGGFAARRRERTDVGGTYRGSGASEP